MIENLISFSIASILLALSPGPDNVYVITQSLANGTKSGIATTIGLISGCIVHTTLLAFGISVIITSSEAIFYGIKIFGALYLLYLAYKVYSSNYKISFTDATPKKTNLQLFKQGVIMNIINPKVMIFFLAFFPGFLWDETQNTVVQFYILGITFMTIAFAIFGTLAILAGTVSDYLLNHKSTGLILKWLQIVVFIGIAVFVLLP